MDYIAMVAGGSYANDNIRSYGLNLASYESEAADKAYSLLGGGAEGKRTFGSWSPVFQDAPGDPRDVGRVILALMDGTPLWPSSSNIVLDHDVTFDARYLYDESQGMAA